MRHFASAEFWEQLASLPAPAQAVARANFELMKADHRHPSIRLKKAGAYWSVRVGLSYRALAREVPDGLLWVWIGTHAEYDKLL